MGRFHRPFRVRHHAEHIARIVDDSGDLPRRAVDAFGITEGDAAFPFQPIERFGIRLPISHGEGRYVADPATLDALEASGRVVLRYADADGAVTAATNPNGSERGIAGIVNERGNVLGLMPHPERAAEAEVGGTDGLRLFRSLERWMQHQPAAAERRL